MLRETHKYFNSVTMQIDKYQCKYKTARKSPVNYNNRKNKASRLSHDKIPNL